MDKKLKEHMAVAKARVALIEIGMIPFESTVDAKFQFDMLAVDDTTRQVYKIQVKYSSTGAVMGRTYSLKNSGYHSLKYDPSEFDLFAVYLPDVDKVVFVPSKYAGCTIATTVRNSATAFFWYEDFLVFSLDDRVKRTAKEFGVMVNTNPRKKRTGAIV